MFHRAPFPELRGYEVRVSPGAVTSEKLATDLSINSLEAPTGIGGRVSAAGAYLGPRAGARGDQGETDAPPWSFGEFRPMTVAEVLADPSHDVPGFTVFLTDYGSVAFAAPDGTYRAPGGTIGATASQAGPGQPVHVATNAQQDGTNLAWNVYPGASADPGGLGLVATGLTQHSGPIAAGISAPAGSWIAFAVVDPLGIPSAVRSFRVA